MTYLITGILSLLFIASLAYQFKGLKPRLQKLDPLHLLPNYSFFAPQPLTNDYRLVYEVLAEKSSGWVEIPMYDLLPAVPAFWNPFKYYNKGLLDSCNFLIQEFSSFENKRLILLSENYLNILRLISGFVNDDNATVRFAILTSAGLGENRLRNVLFVSGHQKL